ncbi:MAG: hypothetical protein J6Y94_04835 [Bacteriovoracaceae bacterium]|nr:hypothetical protein [Bacteriovoracaceae bacterium]
MKVWWYSALGLGVLALILGFLQYGALFNTSYPLLVTWLGLLLWLLAGVLFKPWGPLVFTPALTEAVPSEASPFSWAAWKSAGRAFWQQDTTALGTVDAKASFPLWPRMDTWRWVGLTALVYFFTHYISVETTSWNSFGLFDDAARDLIFLKKYAFGPVWQSVYYTEDGMIAREFIFHYYIYFWFKFLGANVIVFNLALTTLGWATVIFCTLAVRELGQNFRLTLAANFLMQIFPFLFTQEYIGHRYAITPPLLSAMFYFAALLYRRRQLCWALLTGYLAAATVMASIMGRQILYALALAIILKFILAKGKLKISHQWRILLIFGVLGFILAGLPHWFYIFTHHTEYWRREGDLWREFWQGLSGPFLIQRFIRLFKIISVVDADTHYRWGGDYSLLGWGYYPLLLTGMGYLLHQRRFYLVLMGILPVVAAFIAGPFDFRVYLAVPAWLLLLAVGLHWLFKAWPWWRGPKLRLLWSSVVLAALLWQVGNDLIFLYKLQTSPSHIYTLRHIEVARSRMERDLILGRAPQPTLHERDEFYDVDDALAENFPWVGICARSMAVLQLFLPHPSLDQAIRFCTPEVNRPAVEQLKKNFDFIFKADGTRDLLLIWEDERTALPVLRYFQDHQNVGTFKVYDRQVGHLKFKLHAMRIKAVNVRALQIFLQNDLRAGRLLKDHTPPAGKRSKRVLPP